MTVKEGLRKGLLPALLTLLAGAAGYSGQSLLSDANPKLLDSVLPAISKTTLLWLILTLILAIVVLGTWVLILLFEDKTARIIKRYRFDPLFGYYIHRKTGAQVCANCLTTDGIESRMKAVRQRDANGNLQENWACSVKGCKCHYAMSKADVIAMDKRVAEDEKAN